MPSSKTNELLFNPNEEITFLNFLKKISKYILTNLTDVVPLFFAYCMFNLAGENEKTPIAGFSVSCFMFFFAFSYDFFEVENTISAPYFSKGDYRLFTIRTFRVAITNILFFTFSCFLVLLNKPMLELFNLDKDVILETTYFLRYYVPLIGTFFMISNFLRGIIWYLKILVLLFIFY